jgi:hypothetical protein
MGIIVFGTAMVGLPKELWSAHDETEEPIIPYENLSKEEWDAVIDRWADWSKPYPTPIFFSFEPTPGTKSHEILEAKELLSYVEGTENTDDPLRPLNPDPVIGIASRRALGEIYDKVMSPELRRERIKQGNFSLRARLLVEIFNRGSRHAFKRMQ